MLIFEGSFATLQQVKELGIIIAYANGTGIQCTDYCSNIGHSI